MLKRMYTNWPTGIFEVAKMKIPPRTERPAHTEKTMKKR